jgi:hypothetical protein
MTTEGLDMDAVLEQFLDPITGSPARGKQVLGVACLHVDDLFMTGSKEFYAQIVEAIRKDYQIGSEDKDDVVFTGQRLRWFGQTLVCDQERAIEELSEIPLEKSMKDEQVCSPTMHTEYRSVLGQLNWLQSRTQFHIAYRFSRAASAAAAPTIGDVRELNRVVKAVRAQPMTLMFWPLKTKARIIGYPDASYRNNSDQSSQRGQCIFLAEARRPGVADSRGSLVDYESTKIKRTTLSTTVAELYSFMKCFGTCQYLRGLWMDISGEDAEVHMRTDANNLVTTAQTTHLPEQKETIHMIQMLRKEACSGAIHDLAHVVTEYCLSDCLTKASAKPDQLIRAVQTGVLPQCDKHPPFRTRLQHKAYLTGNESGGTEVSEGDRVLTEDLSLDHLMVQGRNGSKHVDYWTFQGSILERHHVVPRRCLFVPHSAPVEMAKLSPDRQTLARTPEEERKIFDVWDSEQSRRSLGVLWTGVTRFRVLQ